MIDNKGHIIILEGADGAGKSRHAENLHGWLNRVYGPPYSPRRIWLVRDPGGTEIGREVRRRLGVDHKEVMYSPRTRLLAHMVASSSIADYYINTMREGDILILDRFYPSTLVYQLPALQETPEALPLLQSYIPKNALVMYLYSHTERLHERVTKRGYTDMSSQDPKSLYDVKEILQRYTAVMNTHVPQWNDVEMINSTGSFRSVAQDVYRLVEKYCRLEHISAAV